MTVSAQLLKYFPSIIVFISQESQKQTSSCLFKCGRRWVCCFAAHPTTGPEVMYSRAQGNLTCCHSPAMTQVSTCPATLATMSSLAEEKRGSAGILVVYHARNLGLFSQHPTSRCIQQTVSFLTVPTSALPKIRLLALLVVLCHDSTTVLFFHLVSGMKCVHFASCQPASQASVNFQGIDT